MVRKEATAMTEQERVADLCERLEKRRQIESFGGYQRVEFEDEDAIDAATELKRIAARCDALEGIERNRDMWKEQCKTQAAILTKLALGSDPA